MRQRKYTRRTPVIVIGILVFIVTWLGGCGGLVVFGGSPITGTVVDAVTKLPVAGALVVLEQADAGGIDRIVASGISATNGSFGLDPPSSGIFDVVADASVRSGSGTTSTYAATVIFGVPANAKINQIPLVPEFGSAIPNGVPIIISGTVISFGTIGAPSEVDVAISALQPVLPAVGSVNEVTIPAFTGSTTSVTTMPSLSCPSGNGCASYVLLIPSGNFSGGTFSASGTHYDLMLQQSGDVSYTLEGRAFFPGSGISPDCTPSSAFSQIIIVSGNLVSANPDLTFSSCL